MTWVSRYPSPIGELLLASDGEFLTGLWMPGQKGYGAGAEDASTHDSLPIFEQAKRWLDDYFAGEESDGAELPLRPAGSPFQKAVWELLLDIPWGELTTYGAVAARLEAATGQRVSPQAVGGAVGRNPISIVIPCHRVVGADGTLTGYAGGLEKKRFLIEHESMGALYTEL